MRSRQHPTPLVSTALLFVVMAMTLLPSTTQAWVSSTTLTFSARPTTTRLQSSTQTPPPPADTAVWDYEVPEDAVVVIKPSAMTRLRELRDQQGVSPLVLRMGVRSGGCSGMSYVMDFAKSEDIQEDDVIDEYPGEQIQCVVDAKSMLYLYGLELDYSNELIGGGFKFYNPNAEESCGCGSSFAV